MHRAVQAEGAQIRKMMLFAELHYLHRRPFLVSTDKEVDMVRHGPQRKRMPSV